MTGPRSASGAVYGEFSGAPSREELERFFFLDDADKARVATRRSASSRLGFALQLGSVRFLGVFLNDPTRVPGEVVDYVAEQVGAPSSALEGYLERRPTRFRHAAEITEVYGYREFAAVEKELVRWLADRAWTTDEGSAVLFDGAVTWLRSRLILLPGLTTLTRLVGRERDAASARGWSELVAPLSAMQERALRRLLVVPGDARLSEKHPIRPTRPLSFDRRSTVVSRQDRRRRAFGGAVALSAENASRESVSWRDTDRGCDATPRCQR